LCSCRCRKRRHPRRFACRWVSAITDFAVEGSAGVDPSSRWGFCLRTLTWLCYAGIVGMARQVIAVLVIVLSFIFFESFFLRLRPNLHRRQLPGFFGTLLYRIWRHRLFLWLLDERSRAGRLSR